MEGQHVGSELFITQVYFRTKHVQFASRPFRGALRPNWDGEEASFTSCNMHLTFAMWHPHFCFMHLNAWLENEDCSWKETLSFPKPTCLWDEAGTGALCTCTLKPCWKHDIKAEQKLCQRKPWKMICTNYEWYELCMKCVWLGYELDAKKSRIWIATWHSQTLPALHPPHPIVASRLEKRSLCLRSKSVQGTSRLHISWDSLTALYP